MYFNFVCAEALSKKKKKDDVPVQLIPTVGIIWVFTGILQTRIAILEAVGSICYFKILPTVFFYI